MLQIDQGYCFVLDGLRQALIGANKGRVHDWHVKHQQRKALSRKRKEKLPNILFGSVQS